MVRPKIIVHTQISLDGAIAGFTDIANYYIVASRFNADMILFGSETVLSAVEEIPPETEASFSKPKEKPGDDRPIWVIPDSRGRIRFLHVFRDTDYCKDLILLLSKTTPQEHIDYLQKRNYDFIIAGEDHVDYPKALEILKNTYHCDTLRTDSGGILTNILIEQGLVDEISLVIAPCLVGNEYPTLFRSLKLDNNISTKLKQLEKLSDDFISLIYEID
ncbi:RibD family protein [bacterium]|nr:RibD family protein [bacterium]